jgi:hypothetical protein
MGPNMFDVYAEWFKREQDGLSEETIKAQLHGMMQILIKLNMELMKRYEQDQSELTTLRKLLVRDLGSPVR